MSVQTKGGGNSDECSEEGGGAFVEFGLQADAGQTRPEHQTCILQRCELDRFMNRDGPQMLTVQMLFWISGSVRVMSGSDLRNWTETFTKVQKGSFILPTILTVS